MLVVLTTRAVRSAHQSLRMLRLISPSVDIERDIVSKSGAGGAGVYFFVVKSHRPLMELSEVHFPASRDFMKVHVYCA
jgi:hypothetical protein